MTFEGSVNERGKTPEATIRIGSNLSVGSDTLYIEANEYTGTLNGGSAVTFTSGEQDVTFISGPRSGENGDAFQYVTFDFDNIVQVTTGANAGGETLCFQPSAVKSISLLVDWTIPRFHSC